LGGGTADLPRVAEPKGSTREASATGAGRQSWRGGCWAVP